MSYRYHDRRVQETVVAGPDNLRQALATHFQLEPPVDAVTLFALVK
ncbi:MAG: hypothetical protein JO264_01215 [Acidisphaera sp.]|nr:hypothetical protein [Acidisphaera sp.]